MNEYDETDELVGDLRPYENIADDADDDGFFLLPLRVAEWFKDAACRGVDQSVFFPDRGGLDAYDTARTICAGCPVPLKCLHHALDEQLNDGMFGGHTPAERKRIRRLQKRNTA